MTKSAPAQGGGSVIFDSKVSFQFNPSGGPTLQG